MSEHLDATSSDVEITFKVKTSGDRNHTMTMPESTKVGELKDKLATVEYEDIPKERQRLIYSGRVMKNDDALSVYKIKAGNTIHMVKSAASNPTPAPSSSDATAAAAPPPPAVPHNMAAGSQANNLLAGLTGARFAGHANLPSADIFGADGGMGAPPSEEQMADLLSNPAVAQSMNEALNNPAFVDMVIQTNPALANMPNARELINSPHFRSMMTNPEHIRMAARMRRMMGGGAGAASSFPAPGVTDTTPPDATAADNNPSDPSAMDNPFATANPFALGGAPGNPFAALFGGPGAGAGTNPTAASATPPSATPASSSAAAASPLGGIPTELFQQFLNSGMPATPPDTRPPEERYAEQLRQLNDMGFYDFDRNVRALQRAGGSVQGAIEQLVNDAV